MTTALDRLKKDRMHHLAAYIEEHVMTTFGVVPEHKPAPVFCDARDDHTGRLCDLDPGHPGDHQSVITITWTRDDT